MSQMPPGQPMSYSQPPKGKSPGLAVASMVCGILSIPVCCVWVLSIILGLLGVVLGIIARGKITRGEASGGGMAVTGIVCGIIGLLFGLTIFSLEHFGGPAAKRWIDRVTHQAQQKMEEEQKKAKERQGTTQESFFEQSLRARNLVIVVA